MGKRKTKMLGIALFVFILLAVFAIFRNFTYKCALSATKEKNYGKLESVSSLPFVNLEGSLVEDFLDAILDRTPNESPLEFACRIGDKKAVEILLNHGANPNASHNFGINNGYQCLDIAIINGNVDIVALLIQNKAESKNISRSLRGYLVNWKNSSFEKVQHNIDVFVEMYQLLDGDNVLGKSQKHALLEGAVSTGNIAILYLLIEEFGYDVYQQNEKKQTLLHVCCASGFLEKEEIMQVVSILKNYKIDFSVKDINDKTAYDIALEVGYPEIAEMIKP